MNRAALMFGVSALARRRARAARQARPDAARAAGGSPVASLSAVVAAQGEVDALGQQLDELEALEPWSPSREAERQGLLKQYAAARRALEQAEIEERLPPEEESEA